jgi:UDP-N-acetylglucosamine transferase subunit ALG13
MPAHHALLTVGSTRFTPLVHSFLSPPSLAALSSLGITTILVQVGASELPFGWTEGPNAPVDGLTVEVIRFAADLEEKVGEAELVISHAGLSVFSAKVERSCSQAV